MGMFDTVNVKCPFCKEVVGCQSKSGECMLDTYVLEEAPIQVMAGILNGAGWTKCHRCKSDLLIEMTRPPRYKVTAMTQKDKSDFEE